MPRQDSTNAMYLVAVMQNADNANDIFRHFSRLLWYMVIYSNELAPRWMMECNLWNTHS